MSNQLSDFERIFVETEYPIAIHSPDHLHPCGTAQDNSVNPRFNHKLYQLYQESLSQRKALDLGCSSGSAVKSFIDMGLFAVGIEGSDFSKKMCRGFWPQLGDKMLFTADITKPFQLKEQRRDKILAVKFDVITIWEVFEHIAETDLPHLVENIKRHLKEDGLVYASIYRSPYLFNGIDLHQTTHDSKWWIDFFYQHKLYLKPDLMKFFCGQYIRGKKAGDVDSFNVVLCLNPALAPKPPKTSLLHKGLDKWLFSKPHRILAKILGVNPLSAS